MYKVLVVDDEKFVRQNVVNVVEWEKLNLEIVALAGNGQEALELIEQFNPNIIITDIKMPLINGIQLIKLVKAKFPKTYFIILSGYDDFQYMQEAIKLGVENYIRKPIEEDELKETLAHIIDKLSNDERTSYEHYMLKENTEYIESPNIDDSHVIDKVLTYINTRYNTDLVLSSVAKEFFINPCYLSSLFKSKTGINFSAYIENIRISKAEELLKLYNAEICEVAYKVGYMDPNYFSKVFKKKTGFSPSNYIKNIKMKD